MKITVKVKDVEIHLNEDVNNTQIKYNNKEIIEILQKISDECLKLLKETKSQLFLITPNTRNKSITKTL